jgi:phosphatidylglycerophosphate synthase
VDLHRAGKIPDWEKVEPENHKFWQRIADRTNGYVTPGNIISVAGAACVFWGLKDINEQRKLKGTLKVGVGRFLDILDGAAANRSETKSPMGEALDATLDKITAAVAIPVLLKNDMLPKKFAAFAGVQNLANVALTAIAKKKGNEIHSGKAGKLSTGFLWGAIGMYGLSQVAEESNKPVLAEAFNLIDKSSEATYVAVGAAATAEYYRAAAA